MPANIARERGSVVQSQESPIGGGSIGNVVILIPRGGVWKGSRSKDQRVQGSRKSSVKRTLLSVGGAVKTCGNVMGEDTDGTVDVERTTTEKAGIEAINGGLNVIVRESIADSSSWIFPRGCGLSGGLTEQRRRHRQRGTERRSQGFREHIKTTPRERERD